MESLCIRFNVDVPPNTKTKLRKPCPIFWTWLLLYIDIGSDGKNGKEMKPYGKYYVYL